MTKKKKEKTAKNKGQWIAYVVFILTGAAAAYSSRCIQVWRGSLKRDIFGYYALCADAHWYIRRHANPNLFSMRQGI